MPAISSQPLLVLPRGLIFCAAIWLIGSLVLAVGLRTPIHATAAALEPGIRLMLQSIAVGLVIGWPLLRLSQQATRRPIGQTLLDLVSLLTLLQVVVWVPRIFTVWSISRTVALDVMLMSWTVLVGAIVAASIGTDRALVRTLGMLACVGIAMFGPVWMWLGLWTETSARDLLVLGPILGVPHLAEGGATRTNLMEWQAIVVIACAGVLCWVVLGVYSGVQALRRRHVIN